MKIHWRCIISMALSIALISAFASAYEIVRETTTTSDGVVLAFERYRNPGATPVILMHGICQNIYCWDLPLGGHTLAIYLADRGYDVWIPNFRGSGPADFHSEVPSSGWTWTVDDHAIYDVPALIDKVIDATGKKPFWVGHSMGGMTLYMYLEGAEYQYVKVDEEWDWVWHGWYWNWEKVRDIFDWRVAANDDLSFDRNRHKLAGVVTVGSPAAMDWELHVDITNFWEYLDDADYWRSNLLLEILANNSLVMAALEAMDQIPVSDVLNFLTDDIGDIPFIGPELQAFLEWVMGHIADSFVGSEVWYEQDMTPEITYEVLDVAVEGLSSRVLQQFMKGVQHHQWLEFNDDDPSRAPYVYSEHYDRVSVPILAVAGDKDKLGNSYIIENVAFNNFSSQDKTYQLLHEFGHVDMAVGIDAEAQTYPLIESWIHARAGTPTPTRTPPPGATATPTPSPTPSRPPSTPTARPSPTVTPSPTQPPPPLTVALELPASHFAGGDTFWLNLIIDNETNTDLTEFPLFIILELDGIYFFGPNWQETIDAYHASFAHGHSSLDIISPLEWPVGLSSGTALFYAAFTDPDITQLASNLSDWEISW